MTLSKTWLVFYNAALAVGWLSVGVEMSRHYRTNASPEKPSVYAHIQRRLSIVQSAALLEIVHALVGVVRTNVALTTFQTLSRIGYLFLVLQRNASNACLGTHVLLWSWTITETVRYSFYALCLLKKKVPYLAVWLRYTVPVLCVPVGITGELWVAYDGLAPVRSLQFDRRFAYDFTVYCLSPVYACYLPYLLRHVFTLRQRALTRANKLD